MDPITTKLARERQELLDLSLRNTLLNYRPLKSRGITIVDELPDQVFRILVSDGKQMTFLPKIEKEEKDDAPDETSNEDDDFAPVGDDLQQEPAPHHTDTKLQSDHTEADLQKRLLNTYYTARTYVEEQGVNVLYLALGMLAWYESPTSDLQRQAPLVLIPVELQRTSVQAPFRLRYTEDDVGGNLSLRAKMEVEFGLELPPMPELDPLSISDYFEAISQAIASKQRWTIQPNIVALGFFSFGTFLMYKDLEIENWPGEASPSQHPVIKALLEDGFPVSSREEQGGQLPHLDEESFIDDYVTPEDSHQVVDADSSQILAILEVNHGRNLVIQGPPGTGKSQTITNIIAEAIGAGKTVLFVAEKMAALEVVKRRLDVVGLGDACLELHSHKTNKRTLVLELQRTLELGKPKTVDGEHDYQALANYQKQLNNYSQAVNTPIGKSSLTPFVVYGRLLQIRHKLRDVQLPELELVNSNPWTLADFQQRLELVQELQRLIQDVGRLVDHPFWGSSFTTSLPEDRRKVAETSRIAAEAIQVVQTTPNILLESLHLPPPTTIAEAENILEMARHLLAVPNLTGVKITANEWLTKRQTVEEAVTAGERLHQLHSQYDHYLISEAWTDNVLEIRKTYVAYGSKWWRVLSGNFRRARRALSGLCQGALPDGVAEQTALVEAILESQRLQPVLAAQEDLLAQLFGEHWQGGKCDWGYVTAVTRWLTTTHLAVRDGRMPSTLLSYDMTFLEGHQGQVIEAAIKKSLQDYNYAIRTVLEATQIDESQRWPEGGLAVLPLAEQTQLLRIWQEENERIQEIVTFNHIARRMTEDGISAVVEVAHTWTEASSYLVDLMQRAWYDSLIKQAFIKHPVLNSFNGAIHEQKIQNFCTLDHNLFELNRYHLAQVHWQKLPRHEAGGQLGILQREFVKKRRHLPIRRLMEQAGNVIQVVKPVFMMGPMSIAMYLPADVLHFDLVVFDEASQVRPVDAFGAILRGKQTVVVGDSKQLPPTSFFNRLVAGEEDEESVTADLESVLGLFIAQGARQRMLRWHYRSRHASLITVSNYAFYDNKLVVFPSSDAISEQRGLVYHHLPETSYDRGKSRTNLKEAQAVAKAVMTHAKAYPDLTLGVAAFSMSQMQAIQDQLERLRRLDPSCESFFAAHPEEPFFVKNLENVQGDEREVILISVGYGRSADGYLAMNFGPLNKEGGERRLNVLITRARLRCEVFTNLKSDDIDLRKTNARGVEVLKNFLQYAETRKLEMPTPSGRDPDSPFEESVAAIIKDLGYEVEYQVGSAGFFIDIGVFDPQRPGNYLLGVECDGASYHSARSARDRDRLRQQVLENLGWTIHRIWSTDWFQNQGPQIRKLAEALEAAKFNKEKNHSSNTGNMTPSESKVVIEREEAKVDLISVNTIYYEKARLKIQNGQNLHEISLSQLARYIKQVVEIESPVHVDEVTQRLLEGAGVKRRGKRIQENINSGIAYAVIQGTVRRQGRFLWKIDVKQVLIVRDRSELPTISQDFELIAPEEIKLAIKTAVTQAYGISLDDLASATCALFGFNRVTENRQNQLFKFVDQMLAEGTLVQKGNSLVVHEPS